jgi:hypothetical protein
MDLGVTSDGRYAVLVRKTEAGSPSLWSFPLEGGDGQEIALGLPSPGFMSFGLSRNNLAVIEIRRGTQPSSRVYVRPMSAGSLGALRLGPAQDLLFVRQELLEQRPGFSRDGKRLAVMGAGSPSLPGAGAAEAILEILPSGGGYPEPIAGTLGLRGSARFLETGEVVVDGLDRVAIVSL